MKKRYFQLFLYALVLFSAHLKISQAASLEDTLILTEDYRPYNYKDNQGKLTGVAVELLKDAFTITGLKLNLNNIRIQPWPRSYRQAKVGKNILLFSVSRVPFRENLFKWAGPIFQSKIVLLAKKNRAISINQTASLNNYTIGGILEDIGYQLVHRLPGFQGSFISSPDPNSLVKMLASERIDMLAYDQLSAKLVFEKNNLDPQDYEAIYTLTQAPLYFAFSANTDQKVVDQLQTAIDTLKAINSL